MRLSPDQARTIVVAAQELTGPDARVRLFGSRLDNLARGGDIDLLMECPAPGGAAGLAGSADRGPSAAPSG